MKRNALLTFACCLVMGIAALIAVPQQALAIPYHATDSELVGTAYAVLNPTTGELDFVRSTETHEDRSTGTVKSVSGGTYTGTIYAGFETDRYAHPWYFVAESVKSVRFVDAVRPTSTYNWFSDLSNCTTMDLSKLDTSKVADMYGMFDSCSSLASLDVSALDTSQCTDMSWTFSYCSSLASLDLSTFDTSKVTSMNNMFYDCESLISIGLSRFNTSNVTRMYRMFAGCSSLTSLDLSSFDTSQVTDMTNMFNGCTSLNKITFGDRFVIN